ncbi:MAG: hypothetical protein WD627_07590 [Actinomycetota bacterium]
MSPLVRPEYSFAPDLSRVEAQALQRLNYRIGLTIVIVMAELWALTAALEAWADGRTEALLWLVGFQTAAFAGALATLIVTPSHHVVRHNTAPIGTPQPATAE